MRFHSAPPKSRTAASLAPHLAIARRGLPFTAADGQTFVRLPIPSGGFYILPVRGQAYRDWFFASFFGDHDTLPTPQAFTAILNHLEAQASVGPGNQRLNVFRRVGSRGPGIFPSQILLDLANPDGQFVEISPSGWQVTAGVNALLQTSRSTLELPAPLASPQAPSPQAPSPQDPPQDPVSPLQTLRSCLNLSSRGDWLRCLAWLLAAFRPSGPFPFLILQGPPGAGKTFAARALRALVDPSTTPLSPLPHNTRHLFSLARHNWVLAFDHISRLSPQLCDALCRLSNGVGVSVREVPGADWFREPLLQYYQRPMLFTVTGRWSPPPDFSDRALTVTLPAIPPSQRRPESALRVVFAESYPRILGALCTAVSTALGAAAAIRLSQAPRCADALAWALAAAPALGCTESEMQQAFLPHAANPFVQSIETLLAAHPHFAGPATQLLELLPPGSSFPTPGSLAHALKRNQPALTAAGIHITFRRSHGARMIEIHRKPGDANLERGIQLASPDPSNSPQTPEPDDLIAA